MTKPEAFAKCVGALLEETAGLGDELQDRLARLIALGKVLMERRTAGAVPTWIDLLLEYQELVARSQDMYEGAGNRRRVPKKSMESLGLGLMFVVQCFGVQEVSVLSYVFDRLDGLDETTRNAIFAAVDEVPGNSSSMMINNAWLSEVARDTLVWGDAASRFTTWPPRRPHGVAASSHFDAIRPVP
jgi:hypothetical protein